MFTPMPHLSDLTHSCCITEVCKEIKNLAECPKNDTNHCLLHLISRKQNFFFLPTACCECVYLTQLVLAWISSTAAGK